MSREPRARIAEGVGVLQEMYEAPGGLIRGSLEVKDGLVNVVQVSGGFTSYPEDKLAELEGALVGSWWVRANLGRRQTLAIELIGFSRRG